MKKAILCIFFLTICVFVKAQSVSYSYKPLAAKGCRVKYTPGWQDGHPFLLIQVKSDRMKFPALPVVLFKSLDGDTIRLEGKSLEDTQETVGLMIGSMMLPVTEYEARAQFFLTEDKIDFFKKGISKVRIYLTPINHERTFNKDKIGAKIYKLFLKAKNKDEDF